MVRRLEEERDEFINSVIAHINQKLPSEDAKALSAFTKQYCSSASPGDLLEFTVMDLYGAMVSHYHFMSKRQAKEVKVRVYNPQYEQHNWQTTHTAIEICCEYRPFLIESIRMILNRLGFDIHLLLYSGKLHTSRDAAGKLLQYYCVAPTSENGTSEICAFIEIDRQGEREVLEKIKSEIESTIEDVDLTVTDWSVMMKTMETVIDEAHTQRAGLERSDLDEVIEFLTWLNNGHFTYLGYCARTLEKQNGHYQWKLSSTSCLGLLRKQGEHYFEPFEEMTKAAQNLALSDQPLILGKTNRLSTVHRPAHTDFVIVKIYDKDGKVIGQHQFIGLYTSAAYNLSPQHIPLLRLKVKKILERAGATVDSHDGKTLLNILETLPRDDLFHGTVEELYDLSVGIMHLQERQRIRLFVRKDHFTRIYSCLVFVPRERFNSRLREKMQMILLQFLGGYQIDFSTRFSESVLARIHFIVRFKEGNTVEYDVAQIEEKLIHVGRTWDDNLREAIVEHFGEEEGNRLSQKYRGAFSAGYRTDYDVRTAVYDISHIEKLSDTNPLEMSFYRPLDEPDGILRFKIYSPNDSIPLSDIIPMMECMGLRVISERPNEVVPKNAQWVWINDFGMEYSAQQDLNVDTVKTVFQEAFYHIWHKEAESDGFNRLVLGVGLNWREVTVLRAYAKYLWQIGFTFMQSYIEDVFVALPHITHDLVRMYLVRFDPALSPEARNEQVNEYRQKIKASLDDVKNIDEDRIIRRYMQVILATIRTNYYQTDEHGAPKAYLSFKFDPSMISELPLPRPLFEIFVYSPKVEGVHLRGAKVARGGIRWSDRRIDLRTEVLGLVKAQQVKNAVIVPLGAKGGFIPKNMPTKATREAVLAEGVACYKTFIRGMLDLTDNLNENKVIPPKQVVRYDADDPYLVVAADKGTATFSDIANSISNEYHFWLSDAFASGGSSGYDHKKMGITARGAWESVKRHFRELSIDIQKTDFTVVGIGDMAGDVFGNGMLLSRHIKLVGAFNHMHIFLDPDPDPEKSFEERYRLFHLPRSTWEDYDATLISQGGGVYTRSSKFIPISEAMQAILGVHETQMVPTELIRALLRAKVDLLWNGGIGTYVKSSLEHNANVGDRTNDALRVNGSELCCKVVGEGGNLGFTQLGRVEYALNGGRLNTDAIDNSGGVDCSDHEVNIKILLNEIVRAGDLTEKQRNILLGDMTEEVAELVIENNRSQIEAISVAEFHAEKSAQMHCRLIDHLEQCGNLNRGLEFLPTNEEIITRQAMEKGLTRPEIAVLLAYYKTMLKRELLASDVPEDPYVARILVTAFPKPLVEHYRKELFSHRLKREIIAMQISNAVLNEMGLGFVHRLQDETGASIPEIIRGYVATRDIFHASRFRDAVNALDFIVEPSIQTRMLHELNRLMRRGTRWFLRHSITKMNIEETVTHFAPCMDQVRLGLKQAFQGTEKQYLSGLAHELIEDNVPEETALITAQMSLMFSALDIVDAATTYRLPVESVTMMYYAIGEKLDLEWFRDQIKLHPVANHWDSLARAAFRDDLDRQQRDLTVAVMLTQQEVDVEAQIDTWISLNKVLIERWKHMVTDLRSIAKREFTMYSVALRELTELANMGMREIQQKRNL